MRKILVTMETDGLRDYVRFPDGKRKILGPISVLKFISRTAPKREQRPALDTYNATGSCVITADLDVMEELFAPVRTRWAASDVASSLMFRGNRTTSTSQGQTMQAKTLLERLGKIEQTITSLDKFAKNDGLIAPKLHEGLRSMAANLHFYNPGDQSKNDAWYVSGVPKVDTVDGPQALPANATHAQAVKAPVDTADKVSTAPVYAPTPSTTPVYAPEPSTTPVYAPGTKSASAVAPTAAPVVSQAPSYDNLVQNTEIAQNVLTTVEETDSKIDALVTAGRKFNASKAKADLFAIASRTRDIVSNVDLAQPWVQRDLVALKKSAEHIHGLFAPAKV